MALEYGISIYMTMIRVGIFWQLPEKILHHDVPWTESKESIDGWINFGGHGEYWDKFCKSSGVEMEYTDFPRGRVIYNPKLKKVRIAASKSIHRNKNVMDEICKIFNIDKYQKIYDEHYESANDLFE